MEEFIQKRVNEAVIAARSETARALWNEGIHDFDRLARLTRLTPDQVKAALSAQIA